MKKFFVTALLVALSIASYCQTGYISVFNNGPNMSTDRYVIGSGATIPLCFAVEQIRDSSWIKFKSKQVIIPSIINGTGSPNYIYTDASGTLTASAPSWYTQTQSDVRYLQSFTELDPLFDTKFAAKSTSGLTEGTNLYYTATRWNTAFGTASTTGLTEGTNLYYTNTRARGSIVFTTTGTGAATYSTTTGALNIPTPATPNTVTITSGVTRPVNSTTYTVSTTNNARVYYTIDISCTASIGSASSGDVLLQYSTNGGTTYVSVGEVKNSNTVTLAIVLNSVTIQRGVISAEIPANALCRMVSTTAGTTTITYITGQEVTY